VFSIPLRTPDHDCVSGSNFSFNICAYQSKPHEEESERRANLDLHIGLLTEHELTRVLQMPDAIQDKLGIVDHANSELADLEMETKPEDVLPEIHRPQEIEVKKSKSYSSGMLFTEE